MKTWGWVILIAAVIVIGGYFIFSQAPTGGDDAAMEAMPGDETGEEAAVENGGDTGADDPADEPAPVVRTFNVSAGNFAFSETVLRVNQGDTVRINFSVADGFHDWVIDEFDARANQMQAGGTQTIEFVADQAGEFEYYCSVGQHRQMGMVGTLIVE
jgi:plastocyanin